MSQFSTSISHSHSSHLPLIALCVGFFMVIIDATIVNVALPLIAHNLQGDMTDLQWVVAGYTLTFACFLLSAGSLGDRIGAKKIFITGLIVFVVTSLGCGLATNFLMLIILRLLQGLGAAMLVPTSLALIHASYENQHDRAKAIGVWAGVGGTSAALGPILGAALSTWFGWRAIFFINLPIGLLGIWLTTKHVPATKRPEQNPKHFDCWGQLFAIASVAALAFSLIEVSSLGWHSEIVWLSLLVFIIGFGLFVCVEQKTANPMFPLYLFKSKTFSTAIAIGMVLNISLYGLLFLLPLYFQQIRSYSVLETGFALLPLTGVVALASYLSGKACSKNGPKKPMLLGLIVGVCSLIALLLMLKEQGPAYWLLVLPFMALGFSVAYTMPAATIAAVHAAPADRAGLASGALNASRQVGSLLGVAVFGALVGTGHFISGMHISLIVSSLVFLCGSIAVWRGVNST
jgi:DHA2 family methylenomycin A resistance protein-like MFS transporter